MTQHTINNLPEDSSGEVSFQDVDASESASKNDKYPEDLVADSEEQAIGGSSELRRIATGESISPPTKDRVTRILTGGTSSRNKKYQKTSLPNMGGGKEYPPDMPDRDPWRVDFDGPEDPIFPHNWPLKKKAICCIVLGFSTLCSTWGSAVFSTASVQVMEEFHIGQVVAALGTALYIAGFASGPILWAPISELYGRKIPLLISMFGLSVFSFATGAAKDYQTVMLGRFFAGFLGAAPMVIVAAAFADIFNNNSRGTAMIIFCGIVFTSPIIAPIVGGFISYSYLGWRWSEYITGIMGAVALAGDILLYEESYHPIILCRKAIELRRRTGNWGIYAPHEAVELDINDIVTKYITRPLRLLFTEPIILLISVYNSFIYGILYLCLTAFPFIFGPGGYNFQGGVAELPYLSLAVGMILAMLITLFLFEPQYKKSLARNNNKQVPEARLPPMISGAIVFPIGLFWLCWCGNYPETVHWAAPTCGGVLIGYSLLQIFLPAMNYIVDSYLSFAASALAGNTFLRCITATGISLVSQILFQNLGTNWTGTLLGCIGVVLAPVPVLFYIYGKKVRQKSKFAFDLD